MEVNNRFKRAGTSGIPDDWNVSRLDEVASISSGTTPLRSLDARYYKNGIYNWAKTLDLTDSEIKETQEKVTDLAVKESGLRIYPPDTVLVAMYGGFNQIGRTGILKIPAATNQAISAIQPKLNVLNSSFLLYMLNYKVEYWKSVASSSRKDPNITSNDVKSFKITYPSLHEQKVIARALADMDELISSLNKLIDKKRLIKQAAMHELITGKKRLPGFDTNKNLKTSQLGSIPEEWRVLRVIDCAEYVDYRGKTPMKTPSGVLLVTARNIRNGFIDYKASEEYIAKSDYETAMKRGKPNIGDVLITTEAPMGMVACVDRQDIALAQRVIKYRGKSDILSNSYLKYYFLSTHFQKLLNENSSGSTAKGIKGSVLHKLPVIIPSIAEQNAISNVLSEIDEEIHLLERKLFKTRDIKAGMMQELLNGRVRLL